MNLTTCDHLRKNVERMGPIPNTPNTIGWQVKVLVLVCWTLAAETSTGVKYLTSVVEKEPELVGEVEVIIYGCGTLSLFWGTLKLSWATMENSGKGHLQGIACLVLPQ